MQGAKITPAYTGMPRGGGSGRTTETLALAHLPEQEERILVAVDYAVQEIRRRRDGEEIIRLVTMVYFEQTHTVEGAAYAAYISRDTAWRKMSAFVKLVAMSLGYI